MTALPPPFAADPADVYIIAEAGVNHDGSVADAHALIELAARCGADLVLGRHAGRGDDRQPPAGRLR
jgi:hypothetical protein